MERSRKKNILKKWLGCDIELDEMIKEVLPSVILIVIAMGLVIYTVVS